MASASPVARATSLSPARVVASVALLASAVALLALVLRGVDARALGAAWAAVEPARIGWLLLAFSLNHALQIARWAVLVGRHRLADGVLACLAGFLAVQLLPLRLGELVRPWVHARGGTPVGRALAALAVERALDLVGLSLVLLWVAIVPELPTFEVAQVDVVGAARRTAGVGAAALVILLALVAGLGPRAASWPVVGGLAGSMGGALRELAAAPGRAAPALLLTAGTWGSYFAYVTAALACFPELPQGPTVGTVTAAAVIAGTTALPTPGFFGSYEASAVAALALFGADEALASAAALFLHVGYLLFVALAAAPAAYLVPYMRSPASPSPGTM